MTASDAIVGKGTLFQRSDGGAGAGVAAYVAWGSTTGSIRLKAAKTGTNGNNRVVEVLVSGSSFVKTALTETVLRITCPTTATVAMVLSYLYQDETFQKYWDGDYNAVGDGTGVVTARTATVTAGGSDGGETFTSIANVLDVGGPNITQSTYEATHMESSNRAREFKAGLIDYGEMPIELHFVFGNAGHQQLLDDIDSGLAINYKVTWSDTEYMIASLIPTGLSAKAPLDGLVTGSLSYKVNGKPTWSF